MCIYIIEENRRWLKSQKAKWLSGWHEELGGKKVKGAGKGNKKNKRERRGRIMEVLRSRKINHIYKPYSNIYVCIYLQSR